MSTNVPAPTFGTAGFSAPAESATLAGTTADINGAFGNNLNPSPATPQGQLAASLAAIIGNVNDSFVFLTQMFDPAYAYGRYQDALARIYFITRNPSQPTVVQCVCIGLVGTVIPTGALAVDTSGNKYTCQQGGTIPSGGSIMLPFANLVPGPIQCPAGTLTQIYQSIVGWDTITNPSPGAIGNLVESRTEFEGRRQLAVAQNSIGALPSILGAVLTVPGVIDAFVTENPTNSALLVGGVTLLPNSIYVVVLGGAPQAVGQAIWSRKAPGCNYNGNTSVTVQDTNSGYSPPYPSYSVSYTIPTALAAFFSVVIVNSPNVPANAATQIQNAIIGAFAGSDGGPRIRIGMALLASRFYAPIAALGTWAQIVSIEMGSINNPIASFTGAVSGNVLTVTAMASGTIAVGQLLDDTTGLLATGISIQSVGTGAGGVGTYILNASQTISSEAMASFLPNQFKLPVNINQVAVTAAANITVSLQ